MVYIIVIMGLLFSACNSEVKMKTEEQKQTETEKFNFLLEQFADIKIMRYKVPGFENLSLDQKKITYYLSQAALCGRDIIFDQNYKHNLTIRKTLEEIYKHYEGNRTSEDFRNFIVYLKKVWFSNGIHHHYSMDKFDPGFDHKYFTELVKGSPDGNFPLEKDQAIDEFIPKITAIIFDPEIAPKRVSLDSSGDLVKLSACNFYENVSQKEAEAFYDVLKDENDETPVSYGLNSKLVKEEGVVKEEVYYEGGKYGPALKQINFWLGKAVEVAENDQQKAVIKKLMEYYKTGDLEVYDEYNVLWVNDLESRIDFVNGFTEVYGDPLGMKATWESVVNFKDIEATKRTVIISSNAQWFEDHSTTDPRFKKKEVKGVSAKVITVSHLGGDCYPSTPIGINLPNADWIRKEHGSKSVTMENITYAYDQASLGNGFLEEFCCSKEESERAEKYGYLAGNLHTDMHECLGHGSGQLLPGTSPEALKNYSSALEETRADLFALYFIMDKKMLDLEIMPTLEVAKAEYDRYIRNGLMTQLTRIRPGKDIEQAHMRNRQLISKWSYENGLAEKVIEKVDREGKTYFKINDYDKLRELFGELLAEIQRIKSEGDYETGKMLVEKYGVKIDQELHVEVLGRFEKLNIAPYGGFINPTFELVKENDEVIDLTISYDDYTNQMLYYSANFSFL